MKDNEMSRIATWINAFVAVICLTVAVAALSTNQKMKLDYIGARELADEMAERKMQRSAERNKQDSAELKSHDQWDERFSAKAFDEPKY